MTRLLLRGQATLEILIVLIFLIPLIFGGIELSRGVAVRAALDSGVGAAVRSLAINPDQWAWARNIVDQTVQQNVFGSAGVGPVYLEAYDSGGTRIDANIRDLHYGDTFYLEGWTEYTPQIPLMSLSTITIRVRHYGVMEQV